MGNTRVILTSAGPDGPHQHFINGSLYPSGTAVDVDLGNLGLKTVDDTFVPPKEAKPAPVELAPNLSKAGAGAASDTIDYPVASIAPTGPAPTKPQAIPSGATQIGETFVMAGEAGADSAGVAITPEPAADDGKPKK